MLALLLTPADGLHAQQAGSSPLKVFILAGQSNMLGQGNISPADTQGTLEYTVANDPDDTYGAIGSGPGSWVIRDDVWIRDQGGAAGGLTIGYGSGSTTVGPELGFGHHVGDLYENQVLIVKAAWGGKSLGVDFRPPSSGGTTGFYYHEILRLVDEAITRLSIDFPEYAGQGTPEIAGFAWHQGWNDRVDPGRSAEYESNMANFIRDIRSDLGVPDLPFVIATSAMDSGVVYTQVEQAQLAMADPAKYPGFAGNVAVIDTRQDYDGLEFWQPAEQSPANQGFHWNRNAMTFVNMGLAMGDAMAALAPPRCPSRLRATGGAGGVTLSWQQGTETPDSVRVLRDSIEIATLDPATATSFLDTSAQPGELDYELIFTMPGVACDPLTFTFDGNIGGLEAFRSPDGVGLTWTNQMAYSSIELRRDGELIEPQLPGTTESYIDRSPPETGLVTYSVVPTNGDATPATVEISLDGPAPGAALIYEPFDYVIGTNVAGQDGGIGFGGPWGTTRNNPKVESPDKAWGNLPSLGGHARGSAWSALVRPIGSTLADAGLMDDGATLWFSVVMDLDGQNVSNADLNLCLGSGFFVPGTFGDRENLESGEGIGITHSRATVQGVFWQNSDADAVSERTENDSSTMINEANGTRALIVGKIEWGSGAEAAETLTLYAPDTELQMGSPIMAPWTIPPLDQSTFDSLALQFKDQAQFDEIRFAASYEDVVGADRPAAAPFTITAIDHLPDSSSVVITWTRAGEGPFSASYSVDLVDWQSGLGDEISVSDDENPGDPDTITKTFDLSGLPVAGEADLFFRIEARSP